MVKRKYAQCGMALLTSMVVVLVLATLAAALLDTHTAQLRQAADNAAFARSRQGALAQLETWLDYLGLTVPAGKAGDRHCPAGEDMAGCTYPDLPPALHHVNRSELLVIDPGTRPPPRLAEAEASSAAAYRSVHYEVSAEAQASGDGPVVSLTQGVLVLHPAGSQ